MVPTLKLSSVDRADYALLKIQPRRCQSPDILPFWSSVLFILVFFQRHAAMVLTSVPLQEPAGNLLSATLIEYMVATTKALVSPKWAVNKSAS